MQKSEAIKNHKIKPEESGYYHVMFTKILPDGERTKDEFHVVLYTKKEFNVFKTHTDKWGLKATGFNEYEVIHDPTLADEKRKKAEEKAEKERLEKAAEEKKIEDEKEEAKEQKAKDDAEIKEIKQYLNDNSIEFDSRLGLTKLRALKNKN